MTIINNKIYGNPGGKTKKRKHKNSGSSDSSADIIRIRSNPPSLYSAGNK